MNLCVIPAFNEQDTIYSVIKSLDSFIDVLVVDDGSSDNTVEEVVKAKSFLIKNDCNKGYEQSLLKGIQWGMRRNYDYIFTYDADRQFSPIDLQNMQNIVNSTKVDFILGVRPKPARLMESVAAWYFKRKFSALDPLCGMKGYKTNLLHSYNFSERVDTSCLGLCKHMLLKIEQKVQLDIKISPRVGTSRFGGRLKANFKIFRSLISIL